MTRPRSTDPSMVIADRQRTMMRNMIEKQALYEATAALELHGPEAAVEVLASYVTPYMRFQPINRDPAP